MDSVALRLRQVIYGLSLLLITGALFSGWLHYSPVPYWDMWGGTLHFIIRFDAEPVRVLFEQHNEHRLIWSRLLFWIDYHWFGGSHAFLVLFNYACAFAAWSIFWRCLNQLNQGVIAAQNIRLLAFVLGAWLFLWTQITNFTWAFQSQFHLAQLMPLLAFLTLSKAAQSDRHLSPTFGAAILLGVCSAGTMANGVLALPLMALWALILRMRWWQAGILALCGFVTLYLYLSDYRTPASHSSVFETFFAHPFDVLGFVFKYLGNPLVHVISPYGPGPWLAALLGLGLTGVTIWLTINLIQQRATDPIVPGLTLFIIYIGASAFLTAGGRVHMGDMIPYGSRYTTPTILAWAALICIFSPLILNRFERAPVIANWLKMAACVLLLGMFVPLLRMLIPDTNYHHNRAMAVLALELGIRDTAQIAHVYPDANAILPIAERASTLDLGVFGDRNYLDARERIQTPYQRTGSYDCIGQVHAISPIEHSDRYVRVSGTLSKSGHPETARVYLLNTQSDIVGIGLFGAKVAAPQTHGLRQHTGFTAYLLASEVSDLQAIASDACVGELGTAP